MGVIIKFQVIKTFNGKPYTVFFFHTLRTEKKTLFFATPTSSFLAYQGVILEIHPNLQYPEWEGRDSFHWSTKK